jgi:hypothetical protein
VTGVQTCALPILAVGSTATRGDIFKWVLFQQVAYEHHAPSENCKNDVFVPAAP